jgi:hypothetical protein
LAAGLSTMMDLRMVAPSLVTVMSPLGVLTWGGARREEGVPS